ncbi:MAG: hypothetical protein EPN74_00815 [Rhodanobacter sp.]|nr:MAG: hypothetical protein EPN74_00815 [Rhodanobacter sp.]
MNAGTVTVMAKPHALRQELVQAQFPAGQTLAQMLGEDADELLRVTINSVDVPRKVWGHLKPRAGSTVHVRMGIQGGNGGKVLRTVALVALAAAAMYITMGGAAGAYGTSATWFAQGSLSASILSVGVTMVGSMDGGSLTAQGGAA